MIVLNNYILWEPWLLEALVSLGTSVFVFIILFSGTSSFTENIGTLVKPHVPTVDLDPTACY